MIQKAAFTRRTLKDSVYDFLRDGLMSGDIAPGQRLTIRGIAQATGTSVMPVREAFRRLMSEGALEPLPSGAMRAPVLDVTRLQELIDIRLTVEGLAAREAAEQRTDAELALVERANDEMIAAVRSGDLSAEARANEAFHFAIYRAAHSPELVRIIEHLWLQAGPALAWATVDDRTTQRSQGLKSHSHHKSVVTALKRRDAAAAEQALRTDIATAGDILVERARRRSAATGD
jgi:DNA-binding GntR family transcriptional regulator